MAISFRAVGAFAESSIGPAGGSVVVSTPAGFAGGDLLLMFAVYDCNNVPAGPTGVGGWTRILDVHAGVSAPSFASPSLSVFRKIATGLETTEALTWSAAAFPAGAPNVTACMVAYPGTDPTGPVELVLSSTLGGNTGVDGVHPQATTATANDWLVSLRARAGTLRTFTNSVGTDVSRAARQFVDVSFNWFDSNTALAAGLQTQRTTTASGAGSNGDIMVTLAVKPGSTSSVVTATAGTAAAAGTAFPLSSTAVNGPWDLCSPGGLPTYRWAVDWNQNGVITTGDVMAPLSPGVTWGYGRDQMRQISPAAIGQASFAVDNSTRVYSPENTGSPLAGSLDAARPMTGQVTYGGVVYPLFSGRIDGYDITVARGNRSVAFTFLDLEASIRDTPVTTGLYSGMRTGDAVNVILDEVGWTGGRDIDPGATLMPWWWLTNVNASTALEDLVQSEGPPAIAYCAPDGTFTFRDRTHRLLRHQSLDVQGSYAAGLVDCAAPPVTGLHFTDPLTYAHGWRDIINTVNFSVAQRGASGDLTAVWTSTGTITLTDGQTTVVNVSASDPFLGAVPPVADTDYTATGGTVTATLGQTSGSTTAIFLQAAGDTVVTGLQLRAYAVATLQTTIVQRSDPVSIQQHGAKSYPNPAPWAGLEDAYAIAGLILYRYAQRRPLVQMRVVAQDPVHYLQVLQRTVSDLVHIRHDELGMDSDFFVEHVAHNAQRMNWTGRPPVHSVVLGCEQQVAPTANPFTFDVRGAGFDQGVFDATADNPATVFVFDDTARGLFDVGLLGT